MRTKYKWGSILLFIVGMALGYYFGIKENIEGLFGLFVIYLGSLCTILFFKLRKKGNVQNIPSTQEILLTTVIYLVSVVGGYYLAKTTGINVLLSYY